MKNKTVSSTATVKKSSCGRRIANELVRNRYLYLMSIPVIAFYILFLYLPMFGLVIAFKNYSIGGGFLAGKWVGLKYFKEYFTSIYFARTLGNTLIISILDIVCGFPVPIIFALLLNELRGNKLKRLAQTASYLPHFISMVVICGMISDFFGMNGLMTKLFILLGGENISYIGTAKYFRGIFVGTNIWQGFGWSSIIYLAALTGVDAQLYEAASIDGAGRWKQLWHVTLPGILNTVIIMLIMRLGHVLSVGYEKVMLLYSTPTYEVADVISSYTYRMGIQSNRYSYSTAVGLFQSVVNVIILLISNYISKKYSETSLF